MLRKSKHFNERWRERVGGRPPSVGKIEGLLDESVRLQRHRDVQTPRGRPIKVLAMYWHVKRNIVLKVDTKRGKIVTVLSPGVKDAHEEG